MKIQIGFYYLLTTLPIVVSGRLRTKNNVTIALVDDLQMEKKYDLIDDNTYGDTYADYILKGNIVEDQENTIIFYDEDIASYDSNNDNLLNYSIMVKNENEAQDEITPEGKNEECNTITMSDSRRQLQGGSTTPMSQNLYAIPYEPGTTVRCNNDHLTHSPAKNRIDMSGTSGGPYRIVAALGGTVRFVEDSHTGNKCKDNNYIWISHVNGEWTKYSHISTNSAAVSVGDTVRIGQYLGIEDRIGCAGGDHLHWEVAIPNDVNNAIDPVGGYIKGRNLIPRICGIPNNIYVAGKSYKVPSVRPGWKEYARHGLPESSFQADFDAASRCGYRMEWNSGYQRALNSVGFNVVYHANRSPYVRWRSHSKITYSDLVQKRNSYASQGYKLTHVDIYTIRNKIRYAAIFQKIGIPSEVRAYFGVTASTHQNYLNNWKAAGWKPRVISVTSYKGTRKYAGLYTKENVGSWVLKSQQTSAEYQSNYNSNKNNGRRLIYLKSYEHNNRIYYCSIWASRAPASYVYAKHGLTGSAYQNSYNFAGNKGYLTSSVSATRIRGKTRWAAFWGK